MHPIILLVDDEEVLLELTKTFLVARLRIPDENVLTAGNGAEALKIIKARKVDLIISDFNMPGVNGLQLLHQIRNSEDPAISNIPFIAMSVCSEFEKDEFLKKERITFSLSHLTLTR